MENTRFKISQYACAVLLIVSSIALVSYQVVAIDDVSRGLLFYVGQAFLMAGSIFGLDYYIKIITKRLWEDELGRRVRTVYRHALRTASRLHPAATLHHEVPAVHHPRHREPLGTRDGEPDAGLHQPRGAPIGHRCRRTYQCHRQGKPLPHRDRHVLGGVAL